jgi:S-DNA-T family DNA segregation ATPase FtsK/SpoIIIE
LTEDNVRRALGSLNIGPITRAVAQGGDGITFPAPIVRDGHGWRAEVDLPFGATATDVIRHRERLAAALRRPLGCVWPEPVPDAHGGRLVIWTGDRHMAESPQRPWPLRRTRSADLWDGAPFGTDQRGRPVPVHLLRSSMLIAGSPRMGIGASLRTLVSAAALDANVELRLFDLHGARDLAIFEPLAHHYASGLDDEPLDSCLASLRELHTEVGFRSKTLVRLATDTPRICPDGVVTHELSRNRDLSLWPVLVVIDECQELFAHPQYGAEAAELCRGILKRGAAVGIVPVLATTRPNTLLTTVCEGVHTRFCLRVHTQVENDKALGSSAYKNGVRATTFAINDKGMGCLVGLSGDPQIVRCYFVDRALAGRVVRRARRRRERAGTLTGGAGRR